MRRYTPRRRPSPVRYRGRLPAYTRRNDSMTDPFFETAAIPLCSGLQALLASPIIPSAATYRRRAAVTFTTERITHRYRWRIGHATRLNQAIGGGRIFTS